ncbi:hypothetical protein FLA_5168 [Filimonas lacunae]|nr:hypothetical protein FLA_5168 [Filimonas lacunae]
MILAVGLFLRCKKPTDGFTYYFNSTVFEYTASYKFSDPANGNSVPAGLTVTAVGNNAGEIYDLSGFKKINVINGMITVGLHPEASPASGSTFTVNLLVQAPGFRDENITVNFVYGDYNKPLKTYPMLNLTKPAAGVAVTTQTIALSNGVSTAPVEVGTSLSATAEQTATLKIDAGTQIQDANGNPINAASVSASVANFDVEKPEALQFIPGGSLVQDGVMINGVPTRILFSPAAMASIEMTAGGTDVKKFSKPVNIEFGLNENTQNPVTGQALKLGDVFKVYSYEVSTNTWTYESSGTVGGTANSLTANFGISHLTTFLIDMAASDNLLCPATSFTVNLQSSNMPGVSTDPYSFKVYSALLQKTVTSTVSVFDSSHTQLVLTGLPKGNITITAYNSLGAQIGSVTLDLCSALTGVLGLDIPVVTPTQPQLTISIAGKCANGNSPAVGTKAPGGTIIMYREAGVGDYKPLGVVNADGNLVTTSLVNNKQYDFNSSFSSPTDGKQVTISRIGQSLTSAENNADYSLSYSDGNTKAVMMFTYAVKNNKYCK